MNLSGKICFIGLLLLATFILPVSPSPAGTFYDKLNDNCFNPNFWGYEIFGEGPTVAEVNNRMEITFPADCTSDVGLGVFPKFFIKGDFDQQVDFNLLDWPAGNGIAFSLSAPVQFGITRTSWEWAPGSWQEGYYVWCLGHPIGSVETSDTDTVGKLRLKRTGNKIEGFYWQSNAWQLLGSYTHPDLAGDGEIGLSAGTLSNVQFAGELVKIGCNNYWLTNRYICNVEGPLLPLLLE